jgi:hypothetical protein
LQSTDTGRKFFSVTEDFFSVWEICHQRINNSHSSRTAKNLQAGPKKFVYVRVAKLGDFPPKKAHFGILLKNVQGIF